MKPIQHVHQGERMRSLVLFAIALNMIVATILLTGGIAHAAGTVTTCSEMSLRAAMAGGGTARRAGYTGLRRFPATPFFNPKP
jgi:hypothetical protein